MLDALLLRTHPSILPAGLRPGSLRDKALGAYLGLAIGDALGATTEFMTPREFVAQYGVHRHMTGGGWLKLKLDALAKGLEETETLGETDIERLIGPSTRLNGAAT